MSLPLTGAGTAPAVPNQIVLAKVVDNVRGVVSVQFNQRVSASSSAGWVIHDVTTGLPLVLDPAVTATGIFLVLTLSSGTMNPGDTITLDYDPFGGNVVPAAPHVADFPVSN